jgi:hypothetical protein
VLGEEDFEGVKFLGYTLDVVQTVDTNDELDALELLLEGRYPFLYLGFLETLVELLRVDSNRESADSNDLTLKLDAVGCCRKSTRKKNISKLHIVLLVEYVQNAGAAAQEVTSVVVCMEADEIAVEYTEQDFVSHGEDTVDFGAGKWCVEEEADLDIFLRVPELLAQHGGHEHEVVVVDPDHVVILYVLGNCLCEQAVGLRVGVPCGLVEGDLTRVVMEQRPHDGVYTLLVLVSG